jgi:Domain of unknown function (DUF4129)
MKRSGGLVVVVATLLLSLWVTAGADRVSIVKPRSGISEGELEERFGEPQESVPLEVEPNESTALPDSIQLVIDIISYLFVAMLLAWIAWAAFDAFRSRRRRRMALRRAAVPDHDTYDAFLDAAHRELITATQDQLDGLLHGEPRNAIVACWIALEDAVERTGVARDPAETPTEFTERIVAQLTVEGRAAENLADLYREARFSKHPMGEAHRQRAVTLLTQLADQLQESLNRRRSVTTSAPSDTSVGPTGGQP